MKKLLCLSIASLAIASSLTASAAPYAQTESQLVAQEARSACVPVESQIESLNVFKNGIVVVRERVDVPGSGKYAIDAPNGAIHGAFFMQSAAKVEATTEEIDAPVKLEEIGGGGIDWVRDFQGIWFKAMLPGQDEYAEVRILSTPQQPQEEINALRLNSSYNSTFSGVLLERKDGGVVYLASAQELRRISVDAEEFANAKFTRRKSRLTFEVQSKTSATIYLSYLTNGMAWAPQYQISLLNDKETSIAQSAVIINEWRDFENVPVALCSGFPQIALKNAKSPLNANSTLSSFFASLNSSQGIRGESMLLSQSAMSNARSALDAKPQAPELNNTEGEFGIDVVSQSVGVRSLKKGARTLVALDEGKTLYSRVVVWDVPSVRDSNGRLLNDNLVAQNQNYGITTSGTTTKFTEPWDSLVFTNPLKRPITTGPASIFMQDLFLAQNMLNWTNPQEETRLPITKALSVRAKSTETERVAPPNQEAKLNLQQNRAIETVMIGSVQYRKITIDAQLVLTNQRAENTIVKLTRQFFGDLDEESIEGFGDDFKCIKISEAGRDYALGINGKSEIRAELKLQPNETKTLKFAYQVYVRI